MRGFGALLVEQRDLSHGTSGRYHGLLHSGGRYVVKDPKAAGECIEENRVLRRIMPHCIEDTGGFFVVTPEDDLDYVPKFVEGCRDRRDHLRGGPGAQALAEEPFLNPRDQPLLPGPGRLGRLVPGRRGDRRLGPGARQPTVLTYHRVDELVRQR